MGTKNPTVKQATGMAPTSTTSLEKTFRMNGTDGDGLLVEKRTVENEIYWDLGRVIGYTAVLAFFYLLTWVAKFILQLFVAKEAWSRLSDKGKRFFAELFHGRERKAEELSSRVQEWMGPVHREEEEEKKEEHRRHQG